MTRFVGTPLRGTEFSSPSDEAVSARVVSDSQPRIRIDAGGRITWSSGSATGDTNLYRSAADTLTTDDVLKATGGIVTLATSGVPTQPLANGAIAVDTTNNVFYFRSNSTWQPVRGSLTVSDSPPSYALPGDMWFESDTGMTFVYYDNFWVEINNQAGPQGPQGPQGPVAANAALLNSINEFTEHNKFVQESGSTDSAVSIRGYTSGGATSAFSVVGTSNGADNYGVFSVSTIGAQASQAFISAYGVFQMFGNTEHRGWMGIQLPPTSSAPYALSATADSSNKDIALFFDSFGTENTWTFKVGGVLEGGEGSKAPVGGGTASLSGNGFTMFITTNSAHGLTQGCVVEIVDVVPTSYRGTFLVTGIINATQFVVQGSGTGAQTTPGSVLIRPRISIRATAPSQPVIIVNGATNQTANLQEWRSGSGAVIAGVGPEGTITLNNTGTVPSSNNASGGYLYAEGGALKWRGSNGTVTTIAPA